MQDLKEAFPEAMRYFLRWKAFKSNAKGDTDDEEDAYDQDLADELDDFSQLYDPESDKKLDAHFFVRCQDWSSHSQERIDFADRRTKTMSADDYDSYSR